MPVSDGRIHPLAATRADPSTEDELEGGPVPEAAAAATAAADTGISKFLTWSRRNEPLGFVVEEPASLSPDEVEYRRW